MKTNIRIVVLFLMASLYASQAYSQDYRFNQFYNAPLNLNPALTGKIPGLYRLVANYRVQSPPVLTPAPYTTFSASADFGLMREQLRGDIFGVGIIASADNQAGGALKTTDLMASWAYHKSFGYNNEHYLSAGFQFGLKNRRLDVSQLFFESQFNPAINGFDASLSNLEAFDRNNYTRLNMNAGIFWSSNFTDNISAFAGGSLYNLMRPKDSFFSSDSERDLKLHMHGGVIFNIDNRFMITPNAIYMTQQTARNWIAGSSVGFNLSGKKNPFETALYVGAWYEGTGAVIASSGIQYKGMQISVSYDRTITDLANANNGFGAFEASIIYMGKPIDSGKRYPIMHCPRF
jgi:type IX secretion system PorP/SprF family membrane protein